MDEPQTHAVEEFAAWAATYDRTIAEEVGKYIGVPYAELLRRVCEAAQVGPDEQVLDVGTGTGALALAIARQLTDGHLLGIDLTPEMLRRAEENARRAGLADCVEFRCAPAEALPIPDGSIDVVVSSIVMHHTDVRKSLREMARVLKPGGRLVIADSAHNPKWETSLGCLVTPVLAVYYLATKRSVALTRSELAAYKQLFTKEEWKAMLLSVGMRTIEVQETPHPTSEWYGSLLLIRARKET